MTQNPLEKSGTVPPIENFEVADEQQCRNFIESKLSQSRWNLSEARRLLVDLGLVEQLFPQLEDVENLVNSSDATIYADFLRLRDAFANRMLGLQNQVRDSSADNVLKSEILQKLAGASTRLAECNSAFSRLAAMHETSMTVSGIQKKTKERLPV